MLFVLALRAAVGTRLALPSRRLLLLLLLPTIPNILFQVVWVSTFYTADVYPTYAVLLQRSSAAWAALFSYAAFREERRSILSGRFLLGTSLALVGVAGLILGKSEALPALAQLSPSLLNGSVLALLAAILWATYSVTVKAAARGTDSLTAFVVVSFYTTIVLGIIAFAAGEPAAIFRGGLDTALLLVASGILCIALAHTLFYSTIKVLGVAISSTFILLSPLATGVISFLRFGETLTIVQMLFGAVLLAGGILTVWTRSPPPLAAEPE